MSYQSPGPYPGLPQYPPTYGGYPEYGPQGKPPRPKQVMWAYYCMLAGAALSVLGGLLGFAEENTIRSAFQTALPDLDTSQVNTLTSVLVGVGLGFGVIEAGLWIWMAFKTKAGRNWAARSEHRVLRLRRSRGVQRGISVLWVLFDQRPDRVDLHDHRRGDGDRGGMRDSRAARDRVPLEQRLDAVLQEGACLSLLSVSVRSRTWLWSADGVPAAAGAGLGSAPCSAAGAGPSAGAAATSAAGRRRRRPSGRVVARRVRKPCGTSVWPTAPR